ncbi:hypothetical protein LXL04_036678 [Taraxacum kok-saghyz]
MAAPSPFFAPESSPTTIGVYCRISNLKAFTGTGRDNGRSFGDTTDSDTEMTCSSPSPSAELSSVSSQIEVARRFFTLARQLIDQDKPSEALQAFILFRNPDHGIHSLNIGLCFHIPNFILYLILTAMSNGGEAAAFQAVNRAKELYRNKINSLRMFLISLPRFVSHGILSPYHLNIHLEFLKACHFRKSDETEVEYQEFHQNMSTLERKICNNQCNAWGAPSLNDPSSISGFGQGLKVVTPRRSREDISRGYCTHYDMDALARVRCDFTIDTVYLPSAPSIHRSSTITVPPQEEIRPHPPTTSDVYLITTSTYPTDTRIRKRRFAPPPAVMTIHTASSL